MDNIKHLAMADQQPAGHEIQAAEQRGYERAQARIAELEGWLRDVTKAAANAQAHLLSSCAYEPTPGEQRTAHEMCGYLDASDLPRRLRTLASLIADRRRAFHNGMRHAEELAAAKPDARRSVRETIATIVGCELSDIVMFEQPRLEARSTRYFLTVEMGETDDGRVSYREDMECYDSPDNEDEQRAARAYEDLARRIAVQREPERVLVGANLPIPAGTYYLGDVQGRPLYALEGSLPADAKVTQHANGVTITLQGDPKIDAFIVSRGDPHGERLSPTEHAAQLRAKLAASEVLHGPFIACEGDWEEG